MSYLSAYLKAGWLNVWDLGLAIHDLNDSQDPKHALFCRENAFVAIYALFSDNKCPLFTRLDIVCFFNRFSYMMASLIRKVQKSNYTNRIEGANSGEEWCASRGGRSHLPRIQKSRIGN